MPVYSLPLISVCMVTYNHEKYIRQAIESVLEQVGEFMLELVIGEDYSKDSTRAIIKEYEAEYPEIIRLLNNDRNLGMAQNFITTAYSCKGKYVAFLDGDDYWCDSQKLQKQLALFQADPEVGLVHSEYHRYFQKSNTLVKNYHRKKSVTYASGYCYNALILEDTVMTLTAMAVTKDVHDALDSVGSMIAGWLMYDYPLWLHIAMNKKFAYVPEPLGVYRVLAVSASHMNDALKQIRFETNVFEIRCFFMGLKSVSGDLSRRVMNRHHYIMIKVYSQYRGHRSAFLQNFFSFQRTNSSLKTFLKSLFLFGKKTSAVLKKPVPN